jgi:hypothetical protein
LPESRQDCAKPLGYTAFSHYYAGRLTAVAASVNDRLIRLDITPKIVPESLGGCFECAPCLRIFSSRSEIWVLLTTDSGDFRRLEEKRGEFFQVFSRRKHLFSGTSKMLTRSLILLDFWLLLYILNAGYPTRRK